MSVVAILVFIKINTSASEILITLNIQYSCNSFNYQWINVFSGLWSWPNNYIVNIISMLKVETYKCRSHQFYRYQSLSQNCDLFWTDTRWWWMLLLQSAKGTWDARSFSWWPCSCLCLRWRPLTFFRRLDLDLSDGISLPHDAFWICIWDWILIIHILLIAI